MILSFTDMITPEMATLIAADIQRLVHVVFYGDICSEMTLKIPFTICLSYHAGITLA